MTSAEAWAHLGAFINSSLLVFTLIGILYMIVITLEFIRDSRKAEYIQNKRKDKGDLNEEN